MKSSFKLLSIKQKKILISVVLLVLILAFLEIAFFALLQPLINFLIGNVKNYSFLSLKYFNNINLDFKYFFLIFIAVFCIRTIISIILSFKKHQLTKDINDEMSIELFKKYLGKSYLFFLQNNSSHFVSKIITQVEKFSYSLIESYIALLVECVLVLAIIFFLMQSFFLETVIFFFSISFLFFIFLFYCKKKNCMYMEKKKYTTINTKFKTYNKVFILYKISS